MSATHPGWTVLHGGALGDLALALRLALRLPRVAAGAPLRIIARVSLGPLPEVQPPLECIAADAVRLHLLHSPDPAPLRPLLTGRRILSFLGAADAPVSAGLRGLDPAALWCIDPRPRDGCAGHITDQWAGDLSRAGALLHTCSRRAAPCLRLPDSVRAAERDRRGIDRRERLILLHPGGGAPAKCWPLEQYAALAAALRAAGVCVRGLLGPVEQESWPAARIAAWSGAAPPIEAAEGAALLRVAAAADLLIGNDSGPGHVAALVGTPSLTLFGPTDAARWRPLGRGAGVLIGAPGAAADWGLAPARVLAEALRVLRAGS